MDPVSWTELRQSQVRVRSPKGTSLESEPHASYGDLERYYPPKSNRLENQDAGVIGSQCFPVFAMLLSMISNFHIQAVRASFLGFPAARSRW